LALRNWVKRLESRAYSGSGRILLKDGSVYRYDSTRAGGELWAYCINLMTRVKEGDALPEEPEILQKIREAKGPIAAIEPFRPTNPERALVDPLVLLEDSSERDLDDPESVPDLSEAPGPQDGD
jgi:hypothetical protein